MSKNVRTLSISELRKMIKEEAEALAAGDVEDVDAKEEAWEDEKGVKHVDQLKAQGVKSEAKIRRLRREAASLSRRLRECHRAIRHYSRQLAEARVRRHRSGE